MQESFKESFLATSNTKLAALYRFFEFRLPKFNPAIVAEVFKWSDLRKGYKDPKPPRRVIWKFQADSKARDITKAYESKSAHQEFNTYLDANILSEPQREKIMALHSASIAQAARELFEAKDHLVDILKSVPDQVLWQVIIEDSGKVRSMFPKAASPETKAKFFERDLS
jgi:hypothetical protein